MKLRPLAIVLGTVTISACSMGEGNTPDVVELTPPAPVVVTPTPSQELKQLIQAASPDGTLQSFIIPDSDDLANIPQDPLNPLTPQTVKLGKLLYHETGLAGEGKTGREGTWSCASCHHAGAGFKSGNVQGIGDGGEGFGARGEMRIMDTSISDDSLLDVQPRASATILNVAFQDVMLWNGQFGNSPGSVNEGIDPQILSTPDTPKVANETQLSGIEVQAIAGSGVHRMEIGEDSILTTNDEYIQMVTDAVLSNPTFAERSLEQVAALSIAAFERTVLANQAPFQRWLRGDETAMAPSEIRGAKVFFGEGNCSACHTGPALSSPVGASADEMFMAVGFADLDIYNVIHGEVPDNARLGRGGFTGNEEDNYKFKIPPLYNLAQSDFFGHGNSFYSVRQVVEYKNEAIPDNKDVGDLDPRFVPLGLNEQQIDDLVQFIEVSLRDDNLERYQPESLPSGKCIINDDVSSRIDLGCY